MEKEESIEHKLGNRLPEKTAHPQYLKLKKIQTKEMGDGLPEKHSPQAILNAIKNQAKFRFKKKEEDHSKEPYRRRNEEICIYT